MTRPTEVDLRDLADRLEREYPGDLAVAMVVDMLRVLDIDDGVPSPPGGGGMWTDGMSDPDTTGAVMLEAVYDNGNLPNDKRKTRFFLPQALDTFGRDLGDRQRDNILYNTTGILFGWTFPQERPLMAVAVERVDIPKGAFNVDGRPGRLRAVQPWGVVADDNGQYVMTTTADPAKAAALWAKAHGG